NSQMMRITFCINRNHLIARSWHNSSISKSVCISSRLSSNESSKVTERVECPSIASSLTPPQEVYTDKSIYDKEIETILKCNWQYAATTHHLRNVGSYVTGSFANEQYVIVNNSNPTATKVEKESTYTSTMSIGAYYNVCRHHASILLPENTHGSLVQADGSNPSMQKSIENFNRKSYGLLPIDNCLTLSDQLVFLRFETDATHSNFLGDLNHRLAPVFASMDQFGFTSALNRTLVHVKTATYHLSCNWKVFVENYLDGGYHVPFAHPGLTNQLSLDSYDIKCHDFGVSIQTCGSNATQSTKDGGDEQNVSTNKKKLPSTLSKSIAAKANPNTPNVDFSERVARGAVYAFIYPNFMINRYGPWLDVNYVIPTGIKSCQVKFDWFLEQSQFNEKGDAVQEFIEKSLNASDQVQKEDMILCDGVQKGIESSAYKRLRGRYAPQIETPLFQFHQIYSKHIGLNF
ncbi:hypothetical protein RFI_28741, partial [Reticulomyxa filosa]